MIQKSTSLLIAILAGLILNGCVTREDIRGLQTDLYDIQKSLENNLGNVKSQTDTVQTTQADLQNTMQDLGQNLAALKVELEDNRNRMKQLSVRLDDLEASLTARMDAQIELLSGSKFVQNPLPSTVFNLANSDYTRGRYDEAIKGFRNYLKLYPKSEEAIESKLKIADCLARQQQPAEAIKAYDDVIENYPKDPLVPTALFRRGQLEEDQGNFQAAEKTYRIIAKTYPYRSEAQSARERLNALTQNPAK